MRSSVGSISSPAENRVESRESWAVTPAASFQKHDCDDDREYSSRKGFDTLCVSRRWASRVPWVCPRARVSSTKGLGRSESGPENLNGDITVFSENNFSAPG